MLCPRAVTALGRRRVTPELWLEHATPGGFTENYHSVAVADGQLDANVNSRYRLRWNGYASDQDESTCAPTSPT